MATATKALALDETLQNVVSELQRITGASVTADLKDLNDVDVSSLQDGEVLKYDAQNQKWKNGEASSTLAGLTDVLLNSLANGQILKYNSTSSKFENAELKTSDDVKNPSEYSYMGLCSYYLGNGGASGSEKVLATFTGGGQEIVGFIFGRTQLFYFAVRTNASLSDFVTDGYSALIGSTYSKRYNASTGKLYMTVPAWGEGWFFGFVRGNITIGS